MGWGWYLFFGIMLLLLLLFLSPIRVLARYESGACTVKAKYLFFTLPLFPLEEKPSKKPKQEKKPKPAEPVPQKEKKKASLSETIELVLLALKAALRPLEKLADRIRFSVWLDLVIGQEDPMDTALAYGKAHGVVSAAFAALSNFFHIRLRRVWIQPDFLREEGEILAQVQVRFAPWMILFAGVGFGVNFLRGYLKQQNEKKVLQPSSASKAVQPEKKAAKR